MFDASHYVPILLAKRGERIALRELPRSILRGFTPCLEVPLAPMDWNTKKRKCLDDHMKNFVKRLGLDCGKGGRFFLDAPQVLNPRELVGGKHPVVFLFSKCSGLDMVPVSGPERHPKYQAAVRCVVETYGRGVCLRIPKDWTEMKPSEVEKTLYNLGATPECTDLIFDVGSIEKSDVPVFARGMCGVLSASAFSSREWRTVTIASGAFPKSMSGLQLGLSSLPRADWELWNLVCNNLPPGSRIPTFGDYGIQTPDWGEFDPRFMKVSGNIRYTTPDAWIVAKGPNVIGKQSWKYSQVYPVLCKSLAGRKEFRGSAFSPGDLFISRCSTGGKPGSPEVWRRQGTSHHIATVVDQLVANSSVI